VLTTLSGASPLCYGPNVSVDAVEQLCGGRAYVVRYLVYLDDNEETKWSRDALGG